MAKNRKLTILLIALSLLLLLPTISSTESVYDLDYDLNYFLNIKALLEENYFYEPTEEQLIEGAIQGLFQNLDENSQYYTIEEFQSLLEDVSGDFVGIGVYIKEENGSIIVISPIEGSPAYKAGIKSGDKLVSVDGKNIKGMNIQEVVDLIKGKVGTTVKIGINRNQKNIIFNIKRTMIRKNPIESKILKDNIGYIKIGQFNQNTYNNLAPILRKFDKEKITNIIIDLRNNPGGLLSEVIKVSKQFIPEGPIVHIRYRGDVEETYYSTLKKPKYKLAVLINENSASASEIFAGAVQDTKIGTILGVTSYGKGTVQQIVPLPLGDGMKLTIAEYFTPNKRSINKKGIKPDIIVVNKKGTRDIQLEKAIEIMNWYKCNTIVMLFFYILVYNCNRAEIGNSSVILQLDYNSI